MKILVVSGCCLKQNSSANLCHRSYINGIIESGHTVDLLCYSEKGINVDNSIENPKVNRFYEYDGLSLYEKLAGNSKRTENKSEKNDIATDSTENRETIKSKLIKSIKKFLRSLYGIYNPSIVWFRRAKKFKTDQYYDLVISMSYPQVSHLLAGYLVKHQRVKTNRWIQLWEDPWTDDIGNKDNHKKCYKAENSLLESGQEIVYVSPITLKKQQELFPTSKEKMRWVPLPSYYKTELLDYKFTENHYGYFGDYVPAIRDITPFYNSALKMNIKVNICGSPYGLLKSKNNINIYPRLPLNELKVYEDNTNVLVCLFNLGGGQIPGKIYQYASTNKIILAILDGPNDEQEIIKSYFKQYNRFVFCENTEESIQEAINKIENNDLDSIKSIPLDDFSAETIVKKLIG